jgi:hypothetical protein
MKNTPSLIVRNGASGPILLQIEQVPAVQAPDELVAHPFGLERSAASRAIRDGHLKAARIGRRLYARRSDVLALVDKFAIKAKPTGDVESDYAALVAQVRGRKWAIDSTATRRAISVIHTRLTIRERSALCSV